MFLRSFALRHLAIYSFLNLVSRSHFSQLKIGEIWIGVSFLLRCYEKEYSCHRVFLIDRLMPQLFFGFLLSFGVSVVAVFPLQRLSSFLGLSLFNVLVKIFVADLHHLALSRVQRHLGDLPYGFHAVSLDGDQIS